MSKKNYTTKKSTDSRKRKILFAIAVMAVIVGVGVFVAIWYPQLLPQNNIGIDSVEPYKEGSGGESAKLTSHYDAAMSEWEKGNKAIAKEHAQKGLDENRQLKISQQEEVPDQAQKIIRLSNIVDGVDPL